MKKVNNKLAVLITHPVQYQVPAFKYLSKKDNINLKVFFGCDHGVVEKFDKDFGVKFKWDCDLTNGFEYEYISKRKLIGLSGLDGIYLAFKSFFKIKKFTITTIKV